MPRVLASLDVLWAFLHERVAMGCGSSTQPSRHSSAQARFTSHCAGLGCEGKGVSWYPVIATRKFSGSWALYVYSKITLLTFPAGPSCPPPPSPSLLGPIAQHNATTCHGHHIPVDSDMARPGVAGSCGIDSACTVSLRACVCVCVCVCEKCGPFSPREHTAHLVCSRQFSGHADAVTNRRAAAAAAVWQPL